MIETISGIETLKVKRPNKANTAVILFHGFGANMHDLFPLHMELDPQGKYDWFFPNGHKVAFPEQGGFGRCWYNLNMREFEEAMMKGLHRDLTNWSSEDFIDGLKVMKSFISEVKQNYQELIIGGFSQGAICSSHLMFEFNPKLAILFSGNLVDQKRFEMYPQIQTQVIQSHGTHDPILSFEGATKLHHLLRDKCASTDFLPFSGAHEIPWNVIELIKKKLN